MKCLNYQIMLEDAQPREGLAHDIVLRIGKTSRREARVRLVFFGAITAVSSVGSVLAVNDVLGDLAGSGFFDYASLFMTDGTTVLAYWQDFLYTIGESVPLLEVSASLACVGAFIVSTSSFMKTKKFADLGHHFA